MKRNFEFDPNKSKSNLEKHGIDFIRAQKLWDDPDLIEIQATAKDELRFLIVASLAEKYWSAVITYRKGNIRIISVRRARKAEVKLYEG